MGIDGAPYGRLMGDVHVAVVARVVWERMAVAERPAEFAGVQFVVAVIDTLCRLAGDVIIDEAEHERAAAFLNAHPRRDRCQSSQYGARRTGPLQAGGFSAAG